MALTQRFLYFQVYGYELCNLLQNSCSSVRMYLSVFLRSWGRVVGFQPYKLSATVTASNNEYVFILNGTFIDDCVGVTVGPADDDATLEIGSNDVDGTEGDETVSEIDDSAGNWSCPAVTREGRVDAVDCSLAAPIAP